MKITRLTRRAWFIRKFLAAKHRLQVQQVRWKFCLQRSFEIEQKYGVY